MNLLPGWTWLTAMATRRAPSSPEAPDPADMGTAFGLDASIERQAFDVQASADRPRTQGGMRPRDDRLVRRPRR